MAARNLLPRCIAFYSRIPIDLLKISASNAMHLGGAYSKREVDSRIYGTFSARPGRVSVFKIRLTVIYHVCITSLTSSNNRPIICNPSHFIFISFNLIYPRYPFSYSIQKKRKTNYNTNFLKLLSMIKIYCLIFHGFVRS